MYDKDLKQHEPHKQFFFIPIEAALYWANLTEHREYILKKVLILKTDIFVIADLIAGIFPEWPELTYRYGKILSAINKKELAVCINGMPKDIADIKTHIYTAPLPDYDNNNYPENVIFLFGDSSINSSKELITIARDDLKNWMIKYYPEENPAFLFSSDSDNDLQQKQDFKSLYKQELAEKENIKKELSEKIKKLQGQNRGLKNRSKKCLEMSFASYLGSVNKWISGETKHEKSVKNIKDVKDIKVKNFSDHINIGGSTIDKKTIKKYIDGFVNEDTSVSEDEE